MDRRLDGRDFLVGDAYSIADIANWPWVRPAKGQGITISDYPNVARWSAMMSSRAAAQVKPPEDRLAPDHGEYNEEQWKVLFQASPKEGPT